MSSSAVSPPPDSPTRMWEQVADHLESFVEAWETAPAPDPGEFAPAGPVELRRIVLVELIKFDIECRVRDGLAQPLEDYVQAFPELGEGAGPPCDLLYEDYHLRQQAGLAADRGDYYGRFPGRADELARLLGGEAIGRSTSVRAARAPTGVNPGDRLDEFELLAVLGEGQFARVFLARQGSMQRLVALKVSASKGAEAQTLARLDHPNIVRVYDQRVIPDRGLLLVYMPYLAGGTLLDVLAHARTVPAELRTGRTLLEGVDAALDRRGELPPAESTARQRWAERSWPAAVAAIGARLAAALEYAHRRDVLHRDVKPANVLLTAEGEPLLADFNVGCCSKLEGAGPAAYFGGSLAYMAPEHLEAFNPAHSRQPESLDGRTDVYGLAVTLWELLTGERPFGPEFLHKEWSATLASLAAGRRAGPTPEAAAALPEGDVPGLRELLVKCLDPDPAARPATAGQMAAELELCLRPKTRALVRPSPGGWRSRVRRHPLLALYLPSVTVNAVASLVNINYNEQEIVAHWLNREAAESAFQAIIPVMNSVLFLLAMTLVAAAVEPIRRGMKLLAAGTPLDAERLAELRRRALRLGTFATAVSAGCWLLAGVVWPTALRIAAGPPGGGITLYANFFLSLAICGLIATVHPYFLITFLSVRVFYPSLLGPTGPAATDRPALARVDRDLGRYRAAAAGVPLLAVALIALQGGGSVLAMTVLSGAGLLGVGLAYAVEGHVRACLAALGEIPARG